jgi:hypothetical protein
LKVNPIFLVKAASSALAVVTSFTGVSKLIAIDD